MTWTRLSDDFYDNDTINDLSHEALRLHVYALTWCNKQLTDGRLTRSRARRLLPEIDTDQVVSELVDSGLWSTAHSPDDFLIDWSGQETAEQVKRRQKRNAESQAAYRDRGDRHAAGDHSACTSRCPHVESKQSRKPLTKPLSKGAPSRPVLSLREEEGQGRAGGPGAASAVRAGIGRCGHEMVTDRHCAMGCEPEAAK